MLTTAAMRTAHIRTARQGHRACPCCAGNLRGRATDQLKRTQRTRENRQWRTEQGVAR